jgi:hypothetical protein
MAGLAGVKTKREDGGRRQRRDKEGEKKRKGKEIKEKSDVAFHEV